eukprot:5007340-Pleurochrysis_carterae.AAC.2
MGPRTRSRSRGSHGESAARARVGHLLSLVGAVEEEGAWRPAAMHGARMSQGNFGCVRACVFGEGEGVTSRSEGCEHVRVSNMKTVSYTHLRAHETDSYL